MSTIDRKTWTTISTQPLYDLATNQQEPQPVPRAPTLTVIDWQPDGPLVGIAADGTAMTSSDATQW